MSDNALQTIQSMDGFKRILEAVERLNTVRNIKDLEALYLRNAGLSQNTINNYRQAVSEFYAFTEGLNPLQVQPGHIEQYFDWQLTKVDRRTAAVKMAGLKKFFSGIAEDVPIYKSPFDTMSDMLKRKITKTDTRPRTKAALTMKEWQTVKTYLEDDQTLKGKQNRAMILFLYSTGLRAFELCSLRWADMSKDDNGYYVQGIGKGGKAFTQFVPENVVQAILEAFRANFNRNPKDSEHLFYSTASYHGKAPAPMTKGVLWIRLKDIGDRLKEAGLLRKDIEFSAHLFRRSSITHLNKRGVDMKTLRNFSRHSSMEVLYEHYVDQKEPPRAEILELVG